MKVGILTSSRADFGIYIPLIKALKNNLEITIEVIVFGSHLSQYQGNSFQEIIDTGIPVIHKITTNLASDDENSISTTYGLTIIKFAEFWKNNSYDFVFCLGDRYEMNASVQAGIPFRINFVHLYGGEVTLGAIDNIYRNQISLASTIHFTSTNNYKNNIIRIIGSKENVYTVGSLSLDDKIDELVLPNDEFHAMFSIPKGDFVLTTFHPETMTPQKNKFYIEEMLKALILIKEKINLVVTLPNSDTHGNLYRNNLIAIGEKYPNKIKIINNFGRIGYFSALNYCSLVLGNSSSGIVEAASFKKYVINVGDRQKGRDTSKNIINCKFDSIEILKAVNETLKMNKFQGMNIYFQKNTANKIVEILIKNKNK